MEIRNARIAYISTSAEEQIHTLSHRQLDRRTGHNVQLHHGDKECDNKAINTLRGRKRLQNHRLTKLGGILREKSRGGLAHHADALSGAEARERDGKHCAEKRKICACENCTQKIRKCHDIAFPTIWSQIFQKEVARHSGRARCNNHLTVIGGNTNAPDLKGFPSSWEAGTAYQILLFKILRRNVGIF